MYIYLLNMQKQSKKSGKQQISTKYPTSFFLRSIQGDQSGCSLDVVDFKTKVVFCKVSYGIRSISWNATLVLMWTKPREQPEWSPCIKVIFLTHQWQEMPLEAGEPADDEAEDGEGDGDLDEEGWKREEQTHIITMKDRCALSSGLVFRVGPNP